MQGQRHLNPDAGYRHDRPGDQVRVVDHRNVTDAGQEHPRSAGQPFACSLAVRQAGTSWSNWAQARVTGHGNGSSGSICSSEV